MEQEYTRSQNTIINTMCGFVNKMINILLPFVIRTVIIYTLSMEYAGLNSLFSSILQVLNLAELGISSGIVYCMYKPMAKHDEDTICAILKYMRRLYRVIGIVVAILGIMIIPFLSYFVKSDIPEGLNIQVLYIIYLINTVIGYFFFAYKSTLLNAGQKIGVINNINTGIVLIQSVSQIAILFILKNYNIYLLVMPIFTFINNIWIFIITKKYYPTIICKGNLLAEVKQDIEIRVKGLFITRFCTTTRNAFDSIFISSFIGLRQVAIYGNYYYILSAVIACISVITTAMTASVGNSLVTESIRKNYNDMRKFNFAFNWVVGFCTACLLVLYQPFMTIWMGKDNLFSNNIVILFCVYFYFLNLGSIRAVYHDAAGLWWEARYRAITEALLNIVLNIVLTYWFGVFGTVLGTLISLVIVNYIYGTQIVFKYYFKGISAKEYFLDNLLYGVATFVICTILYIVSSKIVIIGILGLVIRLILSIFIFNIIYLIVFMKSQVFQECKSMAIGLLHRRYLKSTKRRNEN